MHQPCLVIMAAGMGSRFGGPKQTTPVDEYGHFLLHYSLFDAYRAGFRKVVFVVKEETAEEFRESVGPAVAAAFDVRYAYQKLDTVPDGRTKPWGTAHAVLCAAPEIDGPFAVINSDDYYGIEAYRLLYDFLAVPRPERSYAMVGFRLRNTVTANGSVSRGVCTERGGMLESITERTHIEQRGAESVVEGCLSVPGVYGYVTRPTWAKIRAQDRYGNWFEREGEGVVAQCFCHETEHLDGHLFIEKVEEYVDVEQMQDGEEE